MDLFAVLPLGHERVTEVIAYRTLEREHYALIVMDGLPCWVPVTRLVAAVAA